jgi:hypothetical protein
VVVLQVARTQSLLLVQSLHTPFRHSRVKHSRLLLHAWLKILRGRQAPRLLRSAGAAGRQY